jgi:glyoxylase-like metal-dependent hydrolase (beta-lactamase superfamily II)
MNIITAVLGSVQTNSYIITNNNEAVIIDPEQDAGYFREKCRELQVTPVAILLTHGHFDHIGAVNGLKDALGLTVYAGRDEQELLSDPNLNGSAKMGRVPMKTTADVLVDDGGVLELAGLTVKIIATPGHTAGGVCYLFGDSLMSGDVLFADSFGRTDFPTGSQKALADSIINRLFALPGDTKVYPGHGKSTTIQYEKENNPIYRYRV